MKNNNEYYNDDSEIGLPKRSRKSKKQNEKEIIHNFGPEIENERANSAIKQRKIYENSQYLSHNERAQFENRFTKPKNDSQEYYVHTLKQKTKKIVVATGPAGTGKTLFATEHGVKYYLEGTYEKLIFTHPSNSFDMRRTSPELSRSPPLTLRFAPVSVDEDLGYLPGTLEDKMAPWVRPIYDILYNFMSPKRGNRAIRGENN